jgi:hypothetical protein
VFLHHKATVQEAEQVMYKHRYLWRIINNIG